MCIRDSRCASCVETIVRLEHGDWNREDTRPQLILTEAAHRVRSARVKSFSRVEDSVAERCVDTDRLRCAAQWTDPADTSVHADRAALSHLIEARAVERRAVVT